MADGFFEYPADGGRAEAYRADPRSGDAVGQVIVVHEVWGFSGFIKDACGRLAREGFRAVAPVLYWRDKELFSRKRMVEGMKVVWDLSLDERYVSEKLDAALDQGRASPETRSMLTQLYDGGFRTKLQHDLLSLARRLRAEDPKLPMGVVGFSMGGKLALQLSAEFPDVSACVAYSSEPALGGAARKIRSPTLLLYGGEDKFMMRGLPSFVGDLIEGGTELALKAYPSAGHEFFDRSRRREYRVAAAEDAWATAMAFLKKELSVGWEAGAARGSRTKQKNSGRPSADPSV